jgi:hypothetical protein
MKQVSQINFRCEVCRVDVPCEHQIEDYKEKGWNVDKNREQVYSEFLHLHDFETWQPFCYMQKDSNIFRIGAIAAQREYMRALWILNRFTVYQSPSWFRLCDKVHENWRVLKFMMESNEKLAYWNNKLNGD